MTVDDCEDDLHQALEELMAKDVEIERLRAALERIAWQGRPSSASSGWEGLCGAMREIAIRALKDKK